MKHPSLYSSLKYFIVLHLFFNVQCSWTKNRDDLSTLKQVQIVFRHGDREPDNSYVGGVGALTDVGKKEMYDLGLEIRRLYDKTIVDTEFDPSAILIVSSDRDRTIDSASTLAHGLYKEFNLAASWNPEEKILFEPIPVRSIPKEHDRMLDVTANCPRREELLQLTMTEGAPIYLRENRQMLEYFSQHSRGDLSLIQQMEDGNFTGISQFMLLQEDILFNQSHNLPLPEWTLPLLDNDDFVGAKTIFNRYFLWGDPTFGTEYHRLYSGTLVKTLTENMDQKVNGENVRKLILYSAHDRTVLFLLIALNMDDQRIVNMPPSGAAIMIEMHQHEEGTEPFLKFWYKNETKRNLRHQLKMPNCGDPCPLSRFKQLTHEVITQDYQKECLPTVKPNIRSASLSATAEILHGKAQPYAKGFAVLLIVIGSILVILGIVLVAFNRARRRLYQSI